MTENEFSPDRYTVGPPLVRDALKEMDKIYKLEAEKADLITACDAALDWADANARAFTIETAPTDRDVLFWDGFNKEWQEFRMLDLSLLPPSYTHWREPLPPPTNPPLPEPLERLGEVLRRVKGT